MWKVVSQEEIGALSSDCAIISILLARAMNAELLRWLYDSWEEIDKIAGARWHIVIPSKSSRRVWSTDGPDVSDFDTELSLEIANSYGVSREEFPCLVFEDFCDDTTPIRLSVPDGEKGRVKLVDEFSCLVASLSDADLDRRDWPGRRRTNAAIASALKRQQLASISIRMLPKAVGALARFGFSH
jgi:hypothetical protein